MSTGVDIDALIAEGEAEEKRLRKALIAAGHDELHLAEVVGAIEASFQKPVTPEDRERFGRICQGVIPDAEVADGRSDPQLIELLEPIANGRATERAAAALPARSRKGKSNAIAARMDPRMGVNSARRPGRVRARLALQRAQPEAQDEPQFATRTPSTPLSPSERPPASSPGLSGVARAKARPRFVEAPTEAYRGSMTTGLLPSFQGTSPSPVKLLRVFGAILLVAVGVAGLGMIPRPSPVGVSISAVPVQISTPGQPSTAVAKVPGVDAAPKRDEVIVEAPPVALAPMSAVPDVSPGPVYPPSMAIAPMSAVPDVSGAPAATPQGKSPGSRRPSMTGAPNTPSRRLAPHSAYAID